LKHLFAAVMGAAALLASAGALANYDGQVLLRCVDVGRTSDYFGDLKTLTVIQHPNRSLTLVEESAAGQTTRTSLDAGDYQRGNVTLSSNGALARFLSRESQGWQLVHVDCDESYANVTCTEY